MFFAVSGKELMLTIIIFYQKYIPKTAIVERCGSNII
jgi:hypothetical protein